MQKMSFKCKMEVRKMEALNIQEKHKVLSISCVTLYG